MTDGKETPAKRRAMRHGLFERAISANTARGRRVVDLARQYLRHGPYIDADAAISVAELIAAAEFARAEARRPGASVAEADAAARITASAERRLWRLLHPEPDTAAPLSSVADGADVDDVVVVALRQLKQGPAGQ